MNTEALRIFCEVARQQSFSGAGKKLHITQSAASQAVQNLERDLGRQLIDRSRRPPHLTPAGERFYDGCREVLDSLDRAVNGLKELDHEVAGAVSVASIYSVGLYHTDVIRRFMETYPKATIRLQYLRPNLVVSAVAQDDATFGLVSYPKETRELAVIPWKEERMVLLCPASHRLAKKKKVKLKELDAEPMIAFDRDLTIRKHLDTILDREKVDLRIAMEFDNIETIKQAVEVGAGIAILPEQTVRDSLGKGGLVAVALDSRDMVRPLGIIHRKGKPLTLAAHKFRDLLTGKVGENGTG
ncbi:HTH-type transcriptional activator CmpR [Planctomycetes bacterium Pan216]|uniref:HTH-type transcriptional activator CmpR n=1 Tax=Kolteria novifilia TaxID=2527975 RepID=A0A518B5S6_9BACT|nr:HTH-type transcriptional activator CmpR [Planctomycetes bacterium Pan216]